MSGPLCAGRSPCPRGPGESASAGQEGLGEPAGDEAAGGPTTIVPVICCGCTSQRNGYVPAWSAGTWRSAVADGPVITSVFAIASPDCGKTAMLWGTFSAFVKWIVNAAPPGALIVPTSKARLFAVTFTVPFATVAVPLDAVDPPPPHAADTSEIPTARTMTRSPEAGR